MLKKVNDKIELYRSSMLKQTEELIEDIGKVSNLKDYNDKDLGYSEVNFATKLNDIREQRFVEFAIDKWSIDIENKDEYEIDSFRNNESTKNYFYKKEK